MDSEEDKFKFESEFKLRVGGDRASLADAWMVDGGKDKFKSESEFKLRVGGDRASFRTRG